MSYGIEVFNSSGETVFDSTHPIQLAAYNSTVVGTDINVTATGSSLITLPDYLFGDDQHLFLGAGNDWDVYTGTMVSGGTYTNNRQIAVKAQPILVTIFGGSYAIANPPYAVGDETRLRTTAGTVIDQVDTTSGPGLAGGTYAFNVTSPGATLADFANAYFIVESDSVNMTSYRTSGTTLNLQMKNTSYFAYPQIWARPVSSSYSGRFAMKVDGRSVSIIDYTGNNNSFEIMVSVPGEVFGSITSTTAHHLTGNDAFGLTAVTDDQQQYTSAHPTETHVTYDSRTYPAKPIISLGAEGTTAGTNQTFTLGTLSSSTVKRWCLMDNTVYYKNVSASSFSVWTLQYNWTNNSSINLLWREGFVDSTGGSIFDTMVSKGLFSVAEFGDGA